MSKAYKCPQTSDSCWSRRPKDLFLSSYRCFLEDASILKLIFIAIEDQMFLGMQDFGFAQIQPGLPKSNYFCSNLASIFPKSSQFCPKKFLLKAAAACSVPMALLILFMCIEITILLLLLRSFVALYNDFSFVAPGLK